MPLIGQEPKKILLVGSDVCSEVEHSLFMPTVPSSRRTLEQQP